VSQGEPVNVDFSLTTNPRRDVVTEN